MRNFVAVSAALLAATLAFSAEAQVPQYGTDINLEQAKKVIAAGQAEARKNNWPIAIAIVDNHGFLVAFEKMDGTQTASVAIALDKGSSAAMYRRPTKVIQDAVAGGGAGIRFLNLRGASAVEGGLPIVVGGKIIGGVGVSGVTSDQDGVVAKAGTDALK
ncbi:MAG: heme-binding protein, partial [Pseudomonadota bacterium]